MSSVPSISPTCNYCSLNINPKATQVKDQPLFCGRCRNVFHKKCTNRRAVRGGNWNKDAWFCPDCIVGNDPSQRPHSAALSQNHQQASPRSNQEDPPVHSRTSLLPPASERLSLLQEDTSIIGIQANQNPQVLDPEAPDFLPQNPPMTIANVLPRFPNNSIRQRTSNVPVTDPENEFLKTSLDACRSNIVQQETELKKLREGMGIRNKRIMQLEDQIGVAASYMSSRDTGMAIGNSPGITETNSKLVDCMNLVLTKLTLLSESSAKTQSVNVYNNACDPQKPETASKHTQKTPQQSLKSQMLPRVKLLETQQLLQTIPKQFSSVPCAIEHWNQAVTLIIILRMSMVSTHPFHVQTVE